MSQQKISKFGQTFISYGSYHYNIVNKWIHIICIPLIAATLVCALSYIPWSIQISNQKIGAAQILLAVVMLYYASISLFFSFCMAIFVAGLTLLWKYSFSGMEENSFFNWVIGVHVISWIMQFIGHGVFQKRKPALLDNLGQTLNAPLFVVAQIYEMLGFGGDQMKSWNAQIAKNVAEFRAKSKET